MNSNTDVARLVGDICVSFGLPLLFICLALANIAISSTRGNRKYARLKLRLSLAFSIAVFLYLICSLMFQDRFVLMSLWQRNRVFYSLVYSAAGFLTFAGLGMLVYWKLRPDLWRQNDEELES
jgi:amino acid transporter